jgi:hypothetical protein
LPVTLMLGRLLDGAGRHLQAAELFGRVAPHVDDELLRAELTARVVARRPGVVISFPTPARRSADSSSPLATSD